MRISLAADVLAACGVLRDSALLLWSCAGGVRKRRGRLPLAVSAFALLPLAVAALPLALLLAVSGACMSGGS